MEVLGTYTARVHEELKRTIVEAIVNKVARARGSMVTIRLRDLAYYARTRVASRIRDAYEHYPLGLTFTASQFNYIMNRLVKAGLVKRVNGVYIIDKSSPIWDLARIEPSEAVEELLAVLSLA